MKDRKNNILILFFLFYDKIKGGIEYMKTTFDLVMSKIDEFSIVELVFHYSTNEINHD